MAEASIKRAVRVAFSASGAKKLEATVSKVDDGLQRTGKSGTKALGEAEKATKNLSASMEDSLKPIDDQFKGFDRLNSIIGKFTMVGGFAMMAWEGITAAVEYFNPAAEDAIAKMERLDKQAADLTGSLGKYATVLSQVNILQLAAADENYQKSLKLTARRLGEVRAAKAGEAAEDAILLRQKWELRLASEGVNAVEYDSAAAAVFSTIARRDAFRKQAKESERAANVAAAQTEALAKNLKTLGSHYDALLTPAKDVAEEVEKAATGSVKMSVAVETLAQFVERIANTGPSLSEALGLSGPGGSPLDLESTAIDNAVSAYAALPGQIDAVIAAHGRFSASMDDSYGSMSQMNELIDMQGRSFAAAAYEAVVAGESFAQFANSLAQSIAAQASVEAAYYLAKAAVTAAAYAATGFTNPALLGAAEGYAIGAAGFAAIAGVAAAAASATGGLGAGSGSGGGVAAPVQSSSDMTGSRASDSGPTVVNINLSGSTGAMGRLLIDEINREGSRRGGARVTAQAVRRAS